MNPSEEFNDDVEEMEGGDNFEEGDELELVEELEGEEAEDVDAMAVEEEEEEEDATEVVDQSIFTFSRHTDGVYCIAVHPTLPNVVVTGGIDDKSYLWHVPQTEEPSTIDQVIELGSHTDTITSVGFNFNGNQVLTGSYDGTVKVFDIHTGEHVITLEGPEDIEWAKWHSRGNAIIGGSKDGTAWLWLSHGGQCMQVLTGK
jgi:angio-associated migratory cell protein